MDMKEKARIGALVAFIGHVLFLVDVIALLMWIIPNPLSTNAYLFLFYAGIWFAIFGIILSAFGLYRRSKQIAECSI
jgi:hypothetical protein